MDGQSPFNPLLTSAVPRPMFLTALYPYRLFLAVSPSSNLHNTPLTMSVSLGITSSELSFEIPLLQ